MSRECPKCGYRGEMDEHNLRVDGVDSSITVPVLETCPECGQEV
jgi:ribosomal protein S27AE